MPLLCSAIFKKLRDKFRRVYMYLTYNYYTIVYIWKIFKFPKKPRLIKDETYIILQLPRLLFVAEIPLLDITTPTLHMF